MASTNDSAKLAASDALKVRNPAKLPAPRYFDKDFYEYECEHVWPNVWQMACRLEQIPNVGDWIEYSNVGKSVIVVNTKNGIKAYNNHCRHRGVPIAGGMGNDCGKSAHGNCTQTGFVCPFHGWRWNMEGECTFVFGKHLFEQDLVESDDLALIPVQVETWGGCAFINHNLDAPSLRESLGGTVLDALEAHGMSKLRSEWWYATILPANWKTAMEAFMEGYHVTKTHPQLQQAQPSLYNFRYGKDTDVTNPLVNPKLSTRENIETNIRTMELLSEGMAGMVHKKEIEIAREVSMDDLPEDPNQGVMVWFGRLLSDITTKLRKQGMDAPDLITANQEHPVEAVQFLFPHYFILTYFTAMSSYRIRPLGPESCLFELWSLALVPEGEEKEPQREPVMLPYDSDQFPLIPRQDYSNIPIQQKGLHSDGFEFLRLSHEREGLISNYHRLIDGFIAGKPADKLAKATSMLGENFDGPFLDLGLD